jgi:hypothetical protein
MVAHWGEENPVMSLPLPTSPVLFMNKAYHFVYLFASNQTL